MIPGLPEARMVDLERRPNTIATGGIVAHAKRSVPFVMSLRGMYVHRVRDIVLHNLCGGVHMSVSCWCGQSLLISKRKAGVLLAEVPDGRPVCATCEGRAIGAGKADVQTINGRPAMFSPRRGP